MKGSVFCASGNDLILVLMHSLNGGKENKLVTNYLMKEMSIIWHHLCSFIYQHGKELGEPGTPAFQKEGTLLERRRKKRQWPEPK